MNNVLVVPTQWRIPGQPNPLTVGEVQSSSDIRRKLSEIGLKELEGVLLKYSALKEFQEKAPPMVRDTLRRYKGFSL